MNDELFMIVEEARENMEKTKQHFVDELSKIRAGKASPHMISGVNIDYYGSITPLNQASTVSTPDPKTIVIQPWDKSILQTIEKAILAANLGFNPQNDGEVIRINVPPLTEERRMQLVKFAGQEAENNRISIRSNRKKANEEIKKAQKDGVSEDEAKDAENEVQELTNDYIKEIDELLKKKEEEILTV